MLGYILKYKREATYLRCVSEAYCRDEADMQLVVDGAVGPQHVLEW